MFCVHIDVASQQSLGKDEEESSMIFLPRESLPYHYSWEKTLSYTWILNQVHLDWQVTFKLIFFQLNTDYSMFCFYANGNIHQATFNSKVHVESVIGFIFY